MVAFQRRVLRLRDRVVTACGGTLRCRACAPVLDRAHAQLHRLVGADWQPRSFLAGFAAAPEEILRCRGSRKTNLLLLVYFTGGADGSKFQADGCSADQRLLYDLLTFSPRVWNELLEYDPLTFCELEAHLGVDVAARVDVDPELLGIVRTFRGYREGRGEDIAEHCADAARLGPQFEARVARILGVHRGLCAPPDPPACLEEFAGEYARMMAAVDAGAPGNALVAEHPFYPEMKLFNELVMTGGDRRYFDAALLGGECRTENERRVRRFVRERVGSRAGPHAGPHTGPRAAANRGGADTRASAPH